MAVVVPAGFTITSQDPIDSRITVVDQNARLALNEFNTYPGLIVYQQSTQEVYVLNDTQSVGSNSGWSLLSGSAGSSGFAAEWSLGASGNNDYVFSGDGFPNPASDPEITLVRGQDYKFANDNTAGQHPFQIQTDAPSGGSGTPYNAGVTNNGAAGGAILTWNVPFDAPDQLYYQCTSHPPMSGSIKILSYSSGSGGGSGIFEQTGSFYATTNDLQVTGSIIADSITGSFEGNLDGTAATASYVTLAQTASYVTTAQTASYVLNAISSSYALTASYAISASHEIIKEVSSSYADTASYVENAQTASYVTTAQTASYVLNAISSSYALTASYAISASHEIIKEVSSSYAESASLAESASFVAFDGNRAVTNQDQPVGIRDVNFGANGVADFLEKVYFANTAPTITSTSYLNIPEFTPSGSLIGTINTSDAESQAVTVQTQSSYTADQFRIEGTNQIYFNVEATESMNTDSSQGYDAAALPVRATDTLGLFTDKTLYIQIIPNAAPVWRENSLGGNVIPSETSSLAESSGPGVKSTTYVTDAQGDTITINTGSLSATFKKDFSLTVNANNVVLTQITASLDYDTKQTYNFALTASDEHYPSQDPEAITYLPYEIRVGDNQPPNINNQTLNNPNGINENENVSNSLGLFNSYYRNAGQVGVSNPNGTTTIFVSAVLKSLSVDGVNVPLSTYSGLNQSNPTEEAFDMNSTGYFRRIPGVYLNSDLIDTYVYTVSVRDTFDPTVVSADVTIQVKDDVAPSINDNWSTGPYINESAEINDIVATNSNGITTQAFFSTNYNVQNETVSWQINPSSPFSLTQVSNQQRMSANANISASYFSPATIDFSITASNTFGTENKQAYSVAVTDNQAPTISARTPISVNAPQNAGTNMCNITIQDSPENNTPYVLTLTGADAALLNPVSQNGNGTSWQIQLVNSEANGRSFSYNEVVTDSYGSTRTYARTLEVGNVPSLYYAYLVDLGAYASSVSSTLQMYGDTNDTGNYAANSILESTADGQLGNTEINYSEWTSTLGLSKAYLIGSGSTLTGDNVNILLEGVNQATGSDSNGSLMIIFPSSSATAADFTLASSMNRGSGADSTVGMFTLFADRPGTGIGDAPQPSLVRYFDFKGANIYPNSGGSRFGAIMTYGDTSADINYFYMAASSSNPSNSQ